MSIIERGGLRDVIELLAALRAAPFSGLATDALVACAQSDVYGYPELIRLCLDRWRNVDDGRAGLG